MPTKRASAALPATAPSVSSRRTSFGHSARCWACERSQISFWAAWSSVTENAISVSRVIAPSR